MIGIRDARFSQFVQVALAVGLIGNHYYYPAVACLWLANLPATFIWLLKEVDVEDKESLGVQLPAENMLSKLLACSLCPLVTTAFTFPCFLS